MAEIPTTESSRFSNPDFYQAAGNAASSLGGLASSLEQRKKLKSQKHDIERQRAALGIQLQRDLAGIDKRAAFQSGSQRAAFGAAGVDQVGSAQAVVMRDLQEAATVRSEVLQNYYRTDAELARAKRKIRRAGKMNSINTAIQGVAMAAEIGAAVFTGGAGGGGTMSGGVNPSASAGLA